jgi:hypothetical protein
LHLAQLLAKNSAGNLYIADSYANRVFKVDVSDAPALVFLNTDAGAASSAQDVTVLNLGNAPLTVSQISTAANFSLGGSDTTCSSTGQALASAASCVLGIEFDPATDGTIGGAVILTDNTLNIPGSTQQVALNGNGLAAGTPPTATPTFPWTRNLPQPQLVNITDATPGAIIYYTVDGSVPTLDGSNPATQMGPAPVSVPVVYPVVPTQINAIAASPVQSASAMATASFTVEPIGMTQQAYTSYPSMSPYPSTPVGTPVSFNVEIFLNEGQTLTSAVASVSLGGMQEFIAGPISNCAPGPLVGMVCTVPITFQPAYPGLREVPLTVRTYQGVPNGYSTNSTTNFTLTGVGQAPLAGLNPGLITTVAGNGNLSTLSGPGGLATDGLGDLSVADTAGNTVRKLFLSSTPQRSITVGNGTAGHVDGSSTVAEFNAPQGVAYAGNLDLYIADTGNNVVRSTGSLYIIDSGNQVIRKVDSTTGAMATVAGVAGVSCVTSPEGGLATGTPLCNPTALAVDAAGNLYISSGNRIQRVEIGTGQMWTLAGTSGAGYVGDGGAATGAMLNSAQGLALDPAGNLYVSDYGNAVVREISAGAPPLNFANTSVGSSSSTQQEAVINIGNLPLTISSVSLGTSNFALDEDNCTGAVLAPGLSCLTIAHFSPQSSGALSDMLTITDDSLNASGSTQRVQLSGAGSAVQASTMVVAGSVSTPFYRPAYNITLTANVSSAAGTVNEGGVNFTVGTLGLTASVAVANGTATAIVPIPFGTIPGVYPITASYAGTPNFAPSLDPTQSFTITKASTTTTLVSSLNPSAYDKTTTLTATVADYWGSAPYTGSVTFFDGATNLGTVTQSGGQATLPLVVGELSAGTHSLTAQYSGSVTHAGSTSAVLTQTVNPGASSQSVVPALVGQSTSSALTYSFSNLPADPNFTLAYGLEFAAVPNCFGTDTMICSVDVTFSPLHPGLRQDALVVKDGAGNVLQTTLLSGIGLAPRAVLVPGVISTYAGTGTAGYSGDGGAPASAQLNYPTGVGFDPAGNLYIADAHNNSVRKVNASTGVITTVAGNGTAGESGDHGPATSAQLNNPERVALDGAGNLYISERAGNRIRMVNGATGVITTVAGGGVPVVGGGVLCGPEQTDAAGDGCAATSAQLNMPGSVVVDPAGNLYIADQGNHIVRMVSATTGIITMIAGGGSGCDSCVATSAQLMTPSGIGLDEVGNLYIADAGSGLIRLEAAPNGVSDIIGSITTVAQSSNSLSGTVGVPTSTLLQRPTGVAVDAAGDVYITDTGTEHVLKFESATGGIFNDAGIGTIGYSGDGGLATNAQLDVPTSVSLDTAGNVYFSDMANNAIRMVSASGAPLAFPQTNVGSSSATQTTIVTNTGNSPLSFTGFTASANFTVDPSMTSCSTSVPLAVGHSCGVGVMFTPTAGGALSGTLTIGDNSQNTSGSTQQIPLSGIGYAPVTLTSISLAPSNASILVGGSQQFTATGQYSDGSTQDLSSTAGWTSSNVNIASIGSSGSASAIAVGSTTIAASVGTVTGSTLLTVNNTPTGGNVVVAPVDHTTGAVVASFTFSNISKPGTTSVITSTTAPPIPAGFSVGNSTTPTFYNLSTTAVYTGAIQICINYGATSYSDPSQLHLFHYENGAWKDVTTSLNTASSTVCGSVTSLSPFAVLQAPVTLTSITLTPLSASIAIGGAQQFTATGQYSDGTTQNLTSTVTWTASAAGVATMNATGLATPVALGTTNISASSNGVTSPNVTLSVLAQGVDLIESGVSVTGTPASGGPIQVADTTTDQGIQSAGGSYTFFYLSTDGKTKGTMLTYRSVSALAAGASSSATTSMTLPTNITGTYYVLACANGGNSPIVESNYTNDCTASAAFSVAGPDLIESSVTDPNSGVAGGSISVTDTTTNQGAGATSASYTMFYLSSDGKTAGTMLIYRSVAALAAGASSSATTTMTLPTNITGTYYVLVCANGGNSPIAETNTANNCTTSAAFTVAGADLIESSVSGPTTGVAGGTISVSDTTTNQGGGAAATSYTMFYLSSDGKTKGSMLTYRSVAALAAGASSTATTSMTLPANIAGTNYVLVCANGGNSPIIETNYANDCTASAAFSVAGDDLIESSVSGPTTGVGGGNISVTDTTTNQGVGAASASYTMFYLSSDGKTKGAMLNYRSVAALAAGASSSATTSMTLPANITGTYYVLVCANNSNSPIVETNYSNDCTASAAFTVAGADLIESSVTGPASGAAGGTISVTDTTTNQGGGATSASYTMFYLSTDGKTKGAMLNYRSVAGLAAGASSTATTSMTLPTNITGTNYVLVCANNSNSPVAETNTANDCTASRAMVITH